MRYLPVLQELFESDTVFFLLIGLAISLAVGARIKERRKRLVCIFAALILYGVCEGISNIRTGYLLELLSLFVGTAAIGAFLGNIIGFFAFGRKDTDKRDPDRQL